MGNMAKIKRLGYLTIGVADLDEGVEFYRRVARLDVTERIADTVFMTGGLEHHWVKLQESVRQGVRRIGFEATSEAALDEVRSDLQARGVEPIEGGDMETDRVRRWLRFVDPAGIEVELFVDMMQRPVPPPSPGVVLEKFLHAGWEVPNYEATFDFYTDVLGFRPSDFIGNAVSFLRCEDRYHHSLVLIRSPKSSPSFNHVCFQVESLDDVMRFRHNAVRNGAPIRDDLLRHAPSGSVGVYVKDTARDLAVEYCYGHPQVADDHEPRVLPLAPETVDVWQSPLPDLGGLRPSDPPIASVLPTPSSTATSPAFQLVERERRTPA